MKINAQHIILFLVVCFCSCNLNESQFQRIENFYDSGKYIKAIDFYFENEEELGHELEVLNKIGRCYHELKDYKSAITFFSKAIDLDSDQSIFYSNKGLSEIKFGKYLEGTISCERAILLDPNNVKAYINRSYGLIKMNRLELALEDLDKCLEIKNVSNEDLGFVYGNYATIFLNQKLYKKAEKYSDLALENNEKVYWAYSIRAFLLLNSQKTDAALKTIEKGLSVNPSYGTLLQYKGIILIKKGNVEAGCRFLKSSILNLENPKDFTLVENLLIKYCQT